MKKEVDRCVMAFEEALSGKTVSMICSGDAGVYGMAGLMYEVGVNYPQVELEIIPGVTAATGGAAVLGAPLIHDFCLISLAICSLPGKRLRRVFWRQRRQILWYASTIRPVKSVTIIFRKRAIL